MHHPAAEKLIPLTYLHQTRVKHVTLPIESDVVVSNDYMTALHVASRLVLASQKEKNKRGMTEIITRDKIGNLRVK
jgi:hypothetical protein